MRFVPVRRRTVWLWLLAAVVLGALSWVVWQKRQPPRDDAALSPQARLGHAVFHDRSLSASGQQSCATCHVKEHGHASARGIEHGGTQMQATGERNTPSLRYLWRNSSFHFDEEGKPNGGFFWDGRADTLAAQAVEPFLNPAEMANADKASVVAKLSRASYAREFERLFGAHIWQQPEQAFAAMTQALASYQTEDPAFHRFDSLFDQVAQGKASFNPAQERGWALFKDPEKGNCMACHTAEPAANGSPPLFTDNSYDNLGVPLPVHLRSQGQRHDNDAGLCAQVHVRERADAKNYCGAFKVPSLRNVALRRAFFHNASLQQLREVVAFYATRDTDPQRWYGVNKALNDVKPAYRANVNRDEAPYGQKPGEQPRLSEQDIDDLVAFLHTLTDADLAARAASLAGSTAVANAAVHAAAPVAIPKVVTSR